MKIGSKALLTLPALFFSLILIAQVQKPVQFNFSKEDKSNGLFILKITAKATDGAKIFSIDKISDELPVNSSIVFDSSAEKYLKDTVRENGFGKTEKNAALNNASIKSYADSVTWEQAIQLKAGDSTRIKGSITYYYQKGESVESGEEPISIQFFYTSEKKEVATAATEKTNDPAKQSPWALIFAGIGVGLIAFLTPCVYALVPVTISIFLKRSKTPRQGKKNAIFYAISIIAIYTLVGVLAATVLPKNTLNAISTNWIFNLFIFALFIIFGISFLGAFDINLPSSWGNKIDSKAGIGSYSGIFFMALTLVIVSFSCTGNFIALIISLATPAGKVAGMFGFGVGLALPFAFFALSPSLLKNLSKSGGWQNALKVTLGFLELALALKFLSNVDLDRGWRILDREVFIVLWIVIFAMLGLYLLGKIKFKHDSELPKNDFDLPYVPVPRLLLAMTSFAFVVYLIPGLWGAPLKAVSAFVPPMGTQDFVLSANVSGSKSVSYNDNATKAPQPLKYVGALKKYEPLAAIENNLTIYYDYNEALAAAKLLKKPLMIDFTGIQCVNCREFEGTIWIDKGVAERMKNDFVVVSLFTDYNEELNDDEKKFSKLLGSKVETVGDKFEDLQQQLIGTSAQPNYVFVGTDEKLLAANGYGYDPTTGAKEFILHLDKVKNEFKRRFP